MFFQQDSAHPHMAAAIQNALRGVQQLPWPARTPDHSTIEHTWDMMKWELILLQSLPQPLLNCGNGYKMLGTIYRRWHSASLWSFACENISLRYGQRGLHCVLMWLFGHPLLWHMCFIWYDFFFFGSVDCEGVNCFLCIVPVGKLGLSPGEWMVIREVSDYKIFMIFQRLLKMGEVTGLSSSKKWVLK